MTQKVLTPDDGKAAIYGGCILGGGGGGLIPEGEAKVRELFERYDGPTLISIDELDEDQAVACVALVGAPSAQEASLSADQMVEAVELVRQQADSGLAALMTNENGAATTINGWLQATALGLPVVDSPANGRAHPTGSMGAISLHSRPGYRSLQGFSGGSGDRRFSGTINGVLGEAADVVRQVSVFAGGLVSVCRNPVEVAYIREHAALGGVSQAIELGLVYLAAEAGPTRIAAVVEHLGAERLAQGQVTEVQHVQRGGFDVGLVQVDGLELTFWNEYMTAERDGERLGTFPELLMTLDALTGAPVVTAEISEGQEVVVIKAPVSRLLLGSPMRDASLLAGIEPIVNKNINEHQEALWH